MPQMSVRASALSILGLLALSAHSAHAQPPAAPAERASNPIAGIGAAALRDGEVAPDRARQQWRAQRDAVAGEAAARRALGDDFAGSWIESGPGGGYRLVVASAGAARVAGASVAGVEIRPVARNWRRLQASKQRLDHALQSRRPGLHKPLTGVYTWHVDPASNRVVVRIARDAQAQAVDFAAASGADADALRFEYLDGAPQTTNWIFGGLSYITAYGGGCTAGFVAYKAGVPGVVTAGHCGKAPDKIDVDWSGIGRTPFGQFVHSRFPTADRGWIASSNSFAVSPQIYDWAGNYITVKGSIEAPVGATVCRAGPKTGYRCGQITAKQVTVNYPQGAVYGMTESNACSGFGDSGGPWIDGGGQAQGIQSGNQGNSSAGHNCDTPAAQRKSWFDPLNSILGEYGLVLTTG